MSRIELGPGDEALAADIMTLQEGAWPVYPDEAALKAAWPTPGSGMRAVTLASPRGLWESTGNTWYQIASGPGTSRQSFSRYMGVYPTSDSAAGNRANYYLDVAATTFFLRTRTALGNTSTQIVLASATSGGVGYFEARAPLLPVGSPDADAPKVRIWAVQPSNTGDVTYTRTVDGTPGVFVHLGKDPARVGRVKLVVAGNVSADNLPAMLVERLEALEAHVVRLEAQLGVTRAQQLAQYPPHTEVPVVPAPPDDPPEETEA